MTDVGAELARMRKDIERLQRAARLGYASLDDTALEVRDGNGSLRAQIGQQGDGTTAVNVVNGGPPPAPSTPSAGPALGGVAAGWDGTFAGGAVMPLDWARVEVHASPTAGFTTSPSTLQATIETPQGGIVYIPATAPMYVRLLARNTSGTASAATGTAGPYAPRPVAGDIGVGEITATLIADGAVTTPKLFANAVTTAKLSAGSVDATALKADAITGKTITGGTVTGATVQTAASGARVVLDTAMRLYNSTGDLLAEAVPNAAALGYPNDAGFIVYNTVGIGRYWAQLSRGFIRFGKDGRNYRWSPIIEHYLSGSDNSTVKLGSGAIESGGEEENQATISLVGTSAATVGDHPYVEIGGSGIRDSARADLNVIGGVSSTDLNVAGTSQARGYTAFQSRASTTTSSSTEQIALTQTGVVIKNGRAYRLRVRGLAVNSNANTGVRIRIRRTNLAGTIWLDTYTVTTPTAGANYQYNNENVIVNDTGSDITTTLVMTWVSVSGGNSSLNAGSGLYTTMEVLDIGTATDFNTAQSAT